VKSFHNIIFPAFYLLVSCVPPYVQSCLGLSSSSGIATIVYLSLLVLFFFSGTRLLFSKNLILGLVVVSSFLLVSSAVSYVISYEAGRVFDIEKLIATLPMLLLQTIAASVYARIALNCSPSDIGAALQRILLFLSLCGLGSLFVILPGMQGYGKPVFFFPEPSHYAWALSPVLFAASLISRFDRSKLPTTIIAIFTSLLLAFYFDNVTILVTALFSVLLISISFQFRTATVNVLQLIGFGIALTGLLIVYLRKEYYLPRISLGLLSSGALSSELSLLSGYEEAYLNFLNSYGLGIGFQQMGINLPGGHFAEKIYLNLGLFTNRFDGSIFFAKIVSELGLIGIFISLIVTHRIIQSVLGLLSVQNLCVVNCLSAGFAAPMLFYLYQRGGGYISSTCFFFLMSILIHVPQHRDADRANTLNFPKL
jgi:hypothetical protein